MKSITQYFDELKDKTGSDYKSAAMMNMDRATLSYMRKRGQISDETALKLAKALGKDESELLIAAAIARSAGETRTAWEKVSKLGSYMSLLFLLNGAARIAEYVYYVKWRGLQFSNLKLSFESFKDLKWTMRA